MDLVAAVTALANVVETLARRDAARYPEVEDGIAKARDILSGGADDVVVLGGEDVCSCEAE